MFNKIRTHMKSKKIEKIKDNKDNKDNKDKENTQNKNLTTFNLSKKHLIVDDSHTNRLVLSKYLERIGIEIDEASDGYKCIAKCRENTNINRYDVIWMDVRMPYKDGYETSKQLREMGYVHYIIGLTGHVEKESLNKCISVGMNRVIAKPIMRDELYGLLFHLFGIPSNKEI